MDYKRYQILLVDDELGNLDNLLFAFELTFNIITASSGAEALDIMAREKISVVISDQRMPMMTGTELLSRIKEKYPHTVRILITAYADISAAVEAINSGDVYRYIDKDQSITEIERYIKQGIENYHVRCENRRLYEELNQGTLQTITALAKTVDAKDAYTFGHSERVSENAVGMAGILGFTTEEQELIRIAGLLHDIGKIAISDDILKKPGRLTNQEFDEIKKHPSRGSKIVEPIPKLQAIRNIILNHHECCDGNGYPNGSAFGDSVLESDNQNVSAIFKKLATWILPVLDTFDAMTSPRPYRDAIPHQVAIEEINRCKGSQFVPEVADAFMEFYKTNKEKFTPFSSAIDYKKYPVLIIGENAEQLGTIKNSLGNKFVIETASDLNNAKEVLSINKDICLSLVVQNISALINQEMIGEILAGRFPLTKIALNCSESNSDWDGLINQCQVIKYTFNPVAPQVLNAEIKKSIEEAIVKGENG